MVNKSAVKHYIAQKGLRTSSDFVDALANEVYKHIDKAIQRAKDNKRNTVQGKDI